MFVGADYQDDDSRELLNDLFQRSEAYSETAAYLETIRFVTRFKSQGPYNAYLLARQNPGVSFAASAQHWEREYGASLKPNARPLVILVPFGPIAFVYDIEDVEGSHLPKGVLDPFPASGIVPPSVWTNLIQNAEAHNIGIEFVPDSRLSAGKASKLTTHTQVKSALDTGKQAMLFGSSHPPNAEDGVTARYIVQSNDRHLREQQYITLLHELAHITCGHLGRTFRPDSRPHPWRDRQNLPREVEELEAESVAYIVGRRIGVDARSEEYLASFMIDVQRNSLMRLFDFNAVLGAANRLEVWGSNPPRKAKKVVSQHPREDPDHAG